MSFDEKRVGVSAELAEVRKKKTPTLEPTLGPKTACSFVSTQAYFWLTLLCSPVVIRVTHEYTNGTSWYTAVRSGVGMNVQTRSVSPKVFSVPLSVFVRAELLYESDR